MPLVRLRSPLRELAGGKTELDIEGNTLGEVIRRLEQAYPQLGGWVLDEQGTLRQHVNLFVNGEQARLEAPVTSSDRIHVLPSISGGAVQTTVRPSSVRVAEPDEQRELLLGTRKGLFILRGPREGPMEQVDRRFSGQVVEFAMRDPRSGTYFASVTHG